MEDSRARNTEALNDFQDRSYLLQFLEDGIGCGRMLLRRRDPSDFLMVIELF